MLCVSPLAWINEHDNCYDISISFSALGMGNSIKGLADGLEIQVNVF